MTKAFPLTSIKNNSRDISAVLCYSGRWSDCKYKTWGDFLEGTAILRKRIYEVNSDRWLLYCDDYWLFLLAFVSLLQCKKEILLTANISPEYLAEIRGNAPIFTDQTLENSFYIPDLLRAAVPPCEEILEIPAINGDETSIIMYTSGSTGKPKAVQQRLTEFENDNKFILSKWGDEFLHRKLCSTVNQHHIYGLLFSILLPFTVGVPFKRERMCVPEEFENLTDTQYMIITVPAFLKRAVEIETASSLQLKTPWIFTSSGALDKDTAEKTNAVFGFWPIEVYGSTETSGIAWRQSVNGEEWTVFDNAKINLNNNGCLVIRSPYIKDPAGFETADMAEILKDGRFLLKGRSDFVVKIEGKRISLTEIEARILQSGLAEYACVIPLEDGRQYLAAAIVFNDKGKERFEKSQKYEINKFWKDYLLQYFENQVVPKKWRYPQVLPVDSQGKIKREDISTLFNNMNEKYILNRVIEKTDDSVVIEFSVPKESPYFDGHFPKISILPGVAQVELVSFFAKEYFNSKIAIIEIKKIKFTNIIMPSFPLVLQLNKKGSSVIFKINSLDGETVYSSGTLIIKEA